MVKCIACEWRGNVNECPVVTNGNEWFCTCPDCMNTHIIGE